MSESMRAKANEPSDNMDNRKSQAEAFEQKQETRTYVIDVVRCVGKIGDYIVSIPQSDRATSTIVGGSLVQFTPPQDRGITRGWRVEMDQRELKLWIGAFTFHAVEVLNEPSGRPRYIASQGK